MNYIRTKDNAIYKIENNKLIVGNIKVNCKDLQALEQEGYKIADTIEELCDEFVVISKTQYFITTYSTATYNLAHIRVIIDNLNDRYEVKGAIWTNKGLIYVAKMNQEGELELL